MEPQEEIIRLLALLVRMQTENQTQLIQELSKAGFGPARIADLVGTTSGTVSTSLNKTKKRAGKTGDNGNAGADSAVSGARNRKNRTAKLD